MAMKKKMMYSSVLLITLFLGGCGADGQDDVQSEEQPQQEEKPQNEEESSDVVTTATVREYAEIDDLEESYDAIIIGSGGAGLAAAIEAKDNGLNPVIFESMPIAGGNTMKSSAGMNASQTKFQEAAGIEDNNDWFYEESFVGGNETNDPELLSYMVDHSAEAIDWLDSLGITLDNLTTTGGMSVERTHRPTDGSAVGEYLVNGLLENIDEREIPIFVNSEVLSITEDNGTVTGVTVNVNQTEQKSIESKAVIVATGGFGANLDMVVEYNPELEGYVTTNQEGSIGSGIRMISEVGGDVVDLDQIQIHPTVEQSSGYLITEAVRGEGAILVSDEAVRFVNEMDTRDKVSAAISALPEQKAYLIFDAGVKERVRAVEMYESQGYVTAGETIEELAAEINLDPATLEETVETWNSAISTSEDQGFNRTTAMDNDLSNSPYYAIEIAPGIHHTMGGVRINTLAQALNDAGEPIPGLYAAGELTGGIHGSNRIGGNAVADIIIYGRQAGQQAAEFVNE